MGKQESRTIFYFGAALAVLMLLIFVQKRSSENSKAWMSAWNSPEILQKQKKSVHALHAAPQVQWKKVVENPENKDLKNDYQATTNYVNSYSPKTEYQHPLVASTTFIKKKDQKKNKNKKKAALQAKKAAGKEKSSREFGLSDTDEDMDDLNNNSSAFANGNGAVAAASPQNANEANPEEKKEEANLNSIEYWEKPIFVDQDITMVSKLIESYQVRKVSNGVFYDLVGEMRQDERVTVREFGLVALSATPSVRSFAELTSMKHTDPDDELRSAAGREVANYYEAKRLPHVISSLKMTNSPEASRTTYEALSVLSEASKKYGELAGLDENSPQPRGNANLATVEPRFEQALSVIEQNKLTESSDAKIKGQALQTVEALNKVITI
jgi:hypothetical protein